jgi:hypothetical protein
LEVSGLGQFWTPVNTYGLAPIEILQNMAADGRICINDGADHFYLLALGMIENEGHQGHLFLPFFAHLVSDPFLDFVVILAGWDS